MSKSNKREIRQTGMTNNRIEGLQKIRDQKANKYRSRLDQAIEVSKKNFYNIKKNIVR